MLAIFDKLRELTMFTVSLRLIIALFCGGLIGLERAYKLRAAGFRTHILICLGASVTMLVSQFLLFYMNFSTDPTRLGAQVISGIGFIGAGSILVTQQVRIRGLTTAAGLWTTAIIGLCLGAGFYEIGILATLLVLFAEILLSKLEFKLKKLMRDRNFYLEYNDKLVLPRLFDFCRENRLTISNLEITRAKVHAGENASALFTLTLNKSQQSSDLIHRISKLKGIITIEELQ